MRRFPACSFASSLLAANTGETNENVRWDRIIHCPTESDGASRLFGEWIHLVRATTFDDDGARYTGNPGESYLYICFEFLKQVS